MIDNELVRRDTKVTCALEQTKQQAQVQFCKTGFKTIERNRKATSHLVDVVTVFIVHCIVVFVSKGDRVYKTFAESHDHTR